MTHAAHVAKEPSERNWLLSNPHQPPLAVKEIFLSFFALKTALSKLRQPERELLASKRK
jgi:hypothetical protein